MVDMGRFGWQARWSQRTGWQLRCYKTVASGLKMLYFIDVTLRSAATQPIYKWVRNQTISRIVLLKEDGTNSSPEHQMATISALRKSLMSGLTDES